MPADIRLYYSDPGLTRFEATVVACREQEGRHIIVLDQTAFFPTSGGQPHDVGTLEVVTGVDHPSAPSDAATRESGPRVVRVVDVAETADAGVQHVTDGPIDPGSVVCGTIDAARRFDHMQQHTGQHILSAAFDRLFDARTVGFHLGALVSTLDLDSVVSPDVIAQAESDANRVVWENRPVTIRFATPEEAAALPLRKEPVKAGPLRLIDVAGYDLSACGGTHVSRSGEVGIIAVRSWEKLRGGTRLEFLCGGRALASYRLLQDSVSRSLSLLSVAPEDLPEAIERAQLDNKSLRRTIRALQEKLASHEAASLLARGQRESGAIVIVETVEEWDQAGLKGIASAAASTPGVVAGLLTSTDPALVVIARAADVSLDAGAVLRELLDTFGGRGGGKADLAQGGGLRGTPGDLETALRGFIRRGLQPSS
ncbi:MAG: DHHA1 domain-containing protein [Acidobacteriota bacterium]